MKGYRTITYNIVSGIVGTGILAYLAVFDWETAGFDPSVAVWIGFGAIMLDKAANLYLRTITTTPVGSRDD